MTEGPAVTVLPPGTHVIYTGHIRSEYAESYSVEAVCDCPQCATPGDGEVRYQLHGEHALWDPNGGPEGRGGYERAGGPGLVHVAACHVVPSSEGPQPWQVNWQILNEMGVPAPDWM